MVKRLPPGYRFHPTDVEIIEYYLKRKVTGKPFYSAVITEIDLYKYAPWDLPEKSKLSSGDREWYFFCPRGKRYPNSNRSKRNTDAGYWKSTGNDKTISYDSRTVGMRKTLVFHTGKAPKGDRTDWVMHEYRMEDKELVAAGFSQDAFALCKIFEKSGAGPKTGEHYGAPFNEKEWEDDAAEDLTLLPNSSCPSSSTLLDEPAIISNAIEKQPTTSVVTDVLPNSEPDDDGLWLEELAGILKLSPVNENGPANITDSETLRQFTAQASSSEPRGLYDGLEDLPTDMFASTSYSQGIHNGYGAHYLSYSFGEDFLEMNDFTDLKGKRVLD